MQRKIVATIALVALLGLAVSGCSPAQSEETAPGNSNAQTSPVSEIVEPGFGNIPDFDAQCLTCHGSYEEVAEKTAQYGDSNPHNSVHGGYYSCQNCHEADKVINEDQMCVTCHDWPREEQSSLGR